MTLQDELHEAMLEAYRIAGEATGYWAKYYLRSVKQKGGLATAKRMLRPLKTQAPQKGLQALIEAGRPDLSIEQLVLEPRFAALFTVEELREAERRLEQIPDYARRRNVSPEKNHPEEIRNEELFQEGALKRITVNSYERDAKARVECLRKHGRRCSVCGMSFAEVYGDIGKGFIHVHHRKPLAGMRASYAVNPRIDLIPMCPNCHAMLHTCDPPLGVDELRRIMQTGETNKS